MLNQTIRTQSLHKRLIQVRLLRMFRQLIGKHDTAVACPLRVCSIAARFTTSSRRRPFSL